MGSYSAAAMYTGRQSISTAQEGRLTADPVISSALFATVSCTIEGTLRLISSLAEIVG